MEAVTHALRWVASKGDSQTTNATVLTDSMNLLRKSEKSNRKPYLTNDNVQQIHLQRSLRIYSPGQAGVKENDYTDRMTDKVTITSSLRPGRSKVLRSLRPFLWAQTETTTQDRSPQESGSKKKKKRRSTIPFNWTRYSPCQIGQH